MVFSFEKHDQQITIFDPEVHVFSQYLGHWGQRETTGEHGGPRGATGGNARAQEISHKHKLLFYQRHQDPSSCACLGN